MNILNKVTLKTLIKNKSRTIVTIIGIALSAALICSVTSLAASFYNAMVQDEIYDKGDWHKAMFHVDVESYKKIAFHELTEKSIFTQELGYFYRPDYESSSEPYIQVVGTWGNFELENMGVHTVSGKYPASPNEIMFPVGFTPSYKIGDVITVELSDRYRGDEALFPGEFYQSGETLRTRETRTYTVCGFYECTFWMNNMLTANSYMGLAAITMSDEAMTEDYLYNVYIKLKDPADALIDDFDWLYSNFYSNNTTYIFHTENERLLSLLGVTNSDPVNFVIYGIAALAIALVMTGSISLIYNAFSISVSQRTKQFGLLSSVGATKKQLRRSVLFEALAVCIVGIPVGMIFGLGLVEIGIVALGGVFDSMNLNVPVTLVVSPWALGAAAVISLITVLISAWIPSKRAVSVSAIEAIRQNTDISDKQVKTSKLTGKLFGLSGILASKYYKRSKKRYRSTEASLVVSIVLFITAFAFGHYAVEAILYDSFGADYDLRTYYIPFSEEYTPEMLMEELKAADHVTAVTFLQEQGNITFGETRIKTDQITDKALEKGWAKNPDSSGYAYIRSMIYFIDDEAFRELLKQYNLSEEEFMDPSDPLAVALDGNRLYDSDSGKYITQKLLTSDRVELQKYHLEYDDYGSWYGNRFDENGDLYVSLSVGENYGEEVTEMKVDSFKLKTGKVIYDAPYFISYRFDNIILIYPASLIQTVYPVWDDIKKKDELFYMQSDDHAAAYEEVNKILQSHGFTQGYYEGNYTLEDYAGEQEEARNTITAVQTVAYAFVAMIALISVANVFNTVTTNINLRRREFAMLRSIGMTNGGFNGMIYFECLLYGSKALMCGLPISVAIVLAIYFVMNAGFELSLYIPWLALVLTVFSVFAVVLITMLYSMSNIKKANPIDELKNENI